MAERAKYEKWLEELEAKKGSTPISVFDRVRQDYLSRLQTVMGQMQQHTAALQQHAGNLVTRLRELEGTEEKVLEERAESELRAQVGEITSAEWDNASRKADRSLTKLREDQEVIAADLNQIRDLLGESEPDGRTPKRAADFDELEFLKSVVGSTPPSAPVAAVQPSRAQAAAAAEPPPTPPAAPARNTGSQTAPAEPPGEKQTGKPTPAKASPATKATPAAPAPASKNTPTEGNPLGLGTSGAAQQPKTLKCTACGAMNYPSEWYCEKCGSELTVV